MTGIENVKNVYRDLLQENGRYEEAAAVNKKEFTDPVTDYIKVHGEEELSRGTLNTTFEKISVDLLALDTELSSASQKYLDLMTSVNGTISRIDTILQRESERIEDLNIIAGNFPEFVSIRSLSLEDFTGTCSALDNNTFTTQATDRVKIPLSVFDVRGNGYEGNAYVYSGSRYQSEYLNTSDRTLMGDRPSSTYYEYSRLTCAEQISDYPPDVHFDNEEAKCALYVHGSGFNSIRIASDLDNLIVQQVSVSTDGGVTYEPTMTEPCQVLNSQKKYEDNSYIYGSGIISFPLTGFAKIELSSNGYTADEIAYNKLTVMSDQTTQSQVTRLPYVRRHVIRINDLIGLNNTYSSSSYMDTGELMVNGPAKSLAIFASEYMPPMFPSDNTLYNKPQYFSYFLTVNGTEYEVVPINSHREGIKVLRYSGYSVKDAHTQHIPEPIRTASLRIKLQSPNNSYSPMISNIKVCIGEAATK